MAEKHPELLPQHGPRQTGMEGVWTVWQYRGAKIRPSGVSIYLHLEGHPYDGMTGFSFELALTFVDSWPDHQRMPGATACPCCRSQRCARPSPAPILPPARPVRLPAGR
jgi:hypothetical protein